MLSRLTGRYTHVTLHHLMDNIDLKDAGIRFPRIYRAAGSTATRMLLMANSISVLLPVYRRTLIDKYRGENVHFRAHGILAASRASRLQPAAAILSIAFSPSASGEPTSVVDLLIEAFNELSAQMPNVKLMVAGGNHPRTPGYIESVARALKDDPRIEFTGYVAEEDIPRLFRSSSSLVLPYSSATGASGVAHLACEFGVPIVSAGIHDFREMARMRGWPSSFTKPATQGAWRPNCTSF